MPASILIFALAFGCASPEDLDPEPDQTDAPIVTDRTKYVLDEGPFGPETTINTRFTAPADRTVYLLNCNGTFSQGLQRFEGNEWVEAWIAETNACLSPPIIIAPGESHTGGMTVASGADAEVDFRKTGTRIDGGAYRAIWHDLFTSFDPDSKPFGEQLPIELRVSAPFQIEGPTTRDPSKTSPAVRPAEIISIEPSHAGVSDLASPVHVRFSPSGRIRLSGRPHLYVDGRDVSEEMTSSGSEDDMTLEFLPRGGWAPGPHQIRVVYMDRKGKLHWFAWSFVATR